MRVFCLRLFLNLINASWLLEGIYLRFWRYGSLLSDDSEKLIIIKLDLYGKGEEMVGKVFVDTARNNKPHACYDPAEDKFFTARYLTELGGYGRIYIDSLLFPGIWRELKELLGMSVNVYYFTRPWRWRELRHKLKDELREKFNFREVKKTDFGDAYILWRLYKIGVKRGNIHKWFKLITEVDVELRPLLMFEKTLWDSLISLRHKAEIGVELPDAEEEVERRLRKVREMIVSKAESIIPRFRLIAKEMRLGEGDLAGLTGLAGTLVYLGWPKAMPSIHKSIRYLGLYKAWKENKDKFMERRGRSFQMRYSGMARRYLNILTASLLSREGRFPPKAKDEKQVLRKLINVLREAQSAGCRWGEGHGKAP